MRLHVTEIVFSGVGVVVVGVCVLWNVWNGNYGVVVRPGGGGGGHLSRAADEQNETRAVFGFEKERDFAAKRRR